MSDASAFGFGKFIPGFDFLQNLSQAAQAGSVPPMAHWVGATVSVEDLKKRIEELKAVQFWLEQNSRALSATVQALEVQKMTLSTLQGMNIDVQKMAQAFGMPPASATEPKATARTATAEGEGLSGWPLHGTPTPPSPSASAASAPSETPTESNKGQSTGAAPTSTQDEAAPVAGMAVATQWWNALTQQFQHIAAQALQDPAQQQAMAQATHMGSELAKTASQMVRDAMASTVPAAAPAAKPQSPVGAPRAAARASASKKVKPSTSSDKKPTRAAAKKSPSAAKKSTPRKSAGR